MLKICLQGQEALYNSKVQTVKDEYDARLQEAFQRAKVQFLTCALDG